MKKVRQFEMYTLKEIVYQESLRFLIQGGRWGKNLENQCSADLLAMTDKSGEKHHPVLRMFHMIHFDKKETDFVYHSKWRPSSKLYISCGNRNIADTSKPSEVELQELQTSFDTNYPTHAISVHDCELEFQWVKGFNQLRLFRTFKIRVGDDVAINFSGSKEYIFVHKCLIVTKAMNIYCFIYPLWYNHVNHNAALPIVSKWPGNKDPLIPLPTDVVQEQVFIMHNCNRICNCQENPCFCDLCSIQEVCLVHNLPDCESCTEYVKEDVHSSDNNEFLVFGSALGFEPDI